MRKTTAKYFQAFVYNLIAVSCIESRNVVMIFFGDEEIYCCGSNREGVSVIMHLPILNSRSDETLLSGVERNRRMARAI